MNEHIKKLFDKALDQAVPETWTTLSHEQMARLSSVFADLLIQECARVARATPCPYLDEELRQRLGHTWDMASLAAGQEIVTHFEVE